MNEKHIELIFLNHIYKIGRKYLLHCIHKQLTSRLLHLCYIVYMYNLAIDFEILDGNVSKSGGDIPLR
jgi:hypothetical protein